MPPPAGGGLRHRAHEARGIKTHTLHSGTSATVPVSRRKVFVTNAWRAVRSRKFGQERWCYRSARRGDTALGIWACRPPAPSRGAWPRHHARRADGAAAEHRARRSRCLPPRAVLHHRRQLPVLFRMWTNSASLTSTVRGGRSAEAISGHTPSELYVRVSLRSRDEDLRDECGETLLLRVVGL